MYSTQTDRGKRRSACRTWFLLPVQRIKSELSHYRQTNRQTDRNRRKHNRLHGDNKCEYLLNGVEGQPASLFIIRAVDVSVVPFPQAVGPGTSRRLVREDGEVAVRHVVVLGAEHEPRRDGPPRVTEEEHCANITNIDCCRTCAPRGIIYSRNRERHTLCVHGRPFRSDQRSPDMPLRAAMSLP